MAEDGHLLTDLLLVEREARFRPVYSGAVQQRRVTSPGGSRVVRDIATVSGEANLGQAILLRLLTPRGELEALGHPEYGSRLHELIGRPNTEATRNLVRLFILETLQQERRVAEVRTVSVEPVPGTRDRLDVQLSVQPVGRTSVLDLGPFTLEL